MDHVVPVYFGWGADERYFLVITLKLFDVKYDELLAVQEGVLAGADPSLYAVANQLDVDIQKQLAAEHATGDQGVKRRGCMRSVLGFLKLTKPQDEIWLPKVTLVSIGSRQARSPT